MINYIIQGMVYGFAAAAQPGPFQTYLISQALARGWRRTLPMSAAPLLSDGPILVLVLLVLSQVPAWLVLLLEIAGGVLVVCLGAGAWLSWWRRDPVENQAMAGSGRNVFHATAVNLLNPAPYLFWSLVTGPILLTAWRDTPAKGIGMLVAFYSTMVGACVVIVMFFGMTSRFSPRVTEGLRLAAALALVGFGVYHISRGVWLCL
jgi:threonine/homoserine/homoserine lactone efflux protein